MINSIIMMFQDYFYLRQRVPLLIYLYYSKFKEDDEPGVVKIIQLALFLITMMLLYAISGLLRGVPPSSLIPLNWHYAALLTWPTFFLVYYTTALRAHLNPLTSFTLSTLATVGGGWLYEIPFFHPIQMVFSYNTIFYLNGQIICLLLLVYELHKMDWKMNDKSYMGALLYLAFSLVLFFNWRFMARALGSLYVWIYRLPACMFLLSLLSGVNDE